MTQGGEAIFHPGIIEKTDNQSVYVKILSSSACSSCTVKGACNLAESQEKVVEVRKQQGREYPVGTPVDVVMSRSSGTKAVLLAYLVPFAIVVLSLILLTAAGAGEGISALVSLALLVPYYLLLYRFRNKLKKEFEFTIQSK
ncbi:MAG TPA: SoxR reducing system RseC family protein [Bacteroidales bacterium]|nr:SoxR reducing system RseC family protein [Bacteroidales bacterium]